MTWIQTRNGTAFSLIKPLKEDVDFNEIAYALSHLCRFCGHTKKFYSVAQHSCIVASLLPKPLKLCGLLHDAHEAYIGDIATPVKAALGIPKAAMQALESPILQAIHEAAGQSWPLHEGVAGAIKYADLVALQTERRDLMTVSQKEWQSGYGILPTEKRIRAWTSQQSELRFMELFETLR